jgi:hypothetical protein
MGGYCSKINPKSITTDPVAPEIVLHTMAEGALPKVVIEELKEIPVPRVTEELKETTALTAITVV